MKKQISTNWFDAPLKNTANKAFILRPNMMMPGIRSLDTPYLGMMEWLADELTEQYPAVNDDNGFAGANAIVSNFYGLRTVSGLSMDASIPLADNALLCRSLNLAEGFASSRHRDIFDDVLDAMFERRSIAGASISKISMTGFPKFTHSPVYKRQLALFLRDQSERFLNSWVKCDPHELLRDFDAVPASFIGNRTQVDKVSRDGMSFSSKERQIADWEYAASGGRKGQRMPVDKSVSWEGSFIPGHFKMRRRPVFAYTGPANYFATMLLCQCRHYYLKEYAFTWKHTTPAQIQGKLDQFDVHVGFDVTQFDNTVQRWMIEWLLDGLKRHFDERFVRLLEVSFFAPYFQPPWSPDVKEGRWMSDPTQAGELPLCTGLPSGIALNPDVGKLLMTASMLCVLDDLFGDVHGNVRACLKGQHRSFGLLDMSDDMRIGFKRTPEVAAWLQELSSGDSPSPYFKMELGKGSFLGNVFYTDANGRRSIGPSMVSMVVNWFAAERGITHPARAFWAVGWEERNKFYSTGPSYQGVRGLTDEGWRRFYPDMPSLDAIAARARAELPDSRIRFTTEADLLVLNKPEALNYQLDPSDLSPDVLASFSLVIEPDDLESLYQQYYKGSLQ